MKRFERKVWAVAGVFCLAAIGGCKKAPVAAVPDAGATFLSAQKGGETVSSRNGTAELIVAADGRVSLFLWKAGGGSESLDKTSAILKVALPNFADLPLIAAGDHLEAKATGLPEDRPTLVAVVSRAGEPAEVLRFAPRNTGTSTHRKNAVREAGLEELTARVTDSTCLLRGEGTNEAHRECAIRCIHGGAAIALVEKESKQIFIAAAAPGQSIKDLLLTHVGSEVLVRGRKIAQGGSNFFEVREVHGSHGHEPMHGGAVGMAGDLHLEVLALRAGEVRIYLSDDFRRPLPAQGLEGVLEWRSNAQMKSGPLTAESNARYLFAKTEPLSGAPLEVTARLKLGALASRFGVPNAATEDFFMTFMVDPQEEANRPPTRDVQEAQSQKPNVEDAHAQMVGDVQEVTIIVDSGYSPSKIRIHKDVPTRLRFIRKNSGECTRELVIPELKIRQELAPLKETVVELTPKKAGKLAFHCGMDMLRGELIVEE